MVRGLMTFSDLVEQSIKHTRTEHIACGKRQPEHVVEVRPSLLLFLHNTYIKHFAYL